jgi:glycerate kinase
VAIGGCVEMCEPVEQMGFAGIYPILREKVPLEIAMQRDFAAANVEKIVKKIIYTQNPNKQNKNTYC